LLDEVGMVDVDGDGWRELPSGASFQLAFDLTGRATMPISSAATESFARDLRTVGIDTRIQNLVGHDFLLDSDHPQARSRQGLFMLTDCAPAELDIWTSPHWIFPTEGVMWRIWFLEYNWRATRGERGRGPTGAAKTLLEIYDRGLAEADLNRRHELVWEAVRIHIEEGPFVIGACGDQARPAVIADNFRGVPDLVILGPWSASTPGNLHPEQFWIETGPV
jgi:peptide/nickel transport system substrate-binding protein